VSRSVLVTGGGGFVGQWLARELLARGDRVWLASPRGAPDMSILRAEELNEVRWIATDVRDDAQVKRVIAESRPDAIVHLAGISHVPDAEGAPAAAYEVNVVGTVRMLSAVVAARTAGTIDPVVIVIGSGTQYGDHPPSAMPLSETAEQRPLGSYAATKAAQEIAAFQIARTTGLRVLCTRSFSHSGVGHAPVFLLPSLVERIRSAPPNAAVIHIGNDVVRDYLHVKDAVSAYVALLDRGVPGQAYNVCSGTGASVSELARAALEKAGVKGQVVSDPHLQRRADMPYLVGSPKKLIEETGWKPRYTYEDILNDLLAANPSRLA
jgi:GDP-4-dehydro-6-deoxy-D-mannose reductase